MVPNIGVGELAVLTGCCVGVLVLVAIVVAVVVLAKKKKDGPPQ